MSEEIAIFGGAFNPIHIGHVKIAKYISEIVEEIWVIPCYNHVFSKQLIDFDLRLEMCKIAFKDCPKIKVSSYEKERNLSGSTFELITLLKKEISHANFSFIIGQDNADSIDTWRNKEELLKQVSFIVLPRTNGVLPSQTWYLKKPHKFVSKIVPNISSTQIRQWLKNWFADSKHSLHLKQYLPPGVFEFIQEHSKEIKKQIN